MDVKMKKMKPKDFDDGVDEEDEIEVSEVHPMIQSAEPAGAGGVSVGKSSATRRGGKLSSLRGRLKPSRTRWGRLSKHDDDWGPPLSPNVLRESKSTAIIMASLMFLAGTVLIVIGSLLLTGHIETEFWDRGYPLIIIGSILFLPGSYHVFIAYKAWTGARGYSMDQIPTW